MSCDVRIRIVPYRIVQAIRLQRERQTIKRRRDVTRRRSQHDTTDAIGGKVEVALDSLFLYVCRMLLRARLVDGEIESRFRITG